MKPNAATKSKPKDQNEGWLWHMSGKGKMTEKEMAKWEAKGNPHLHVELQMLMAFISGERVQWFHAEAEMQRWQEQVEQKLAELLRTIQSFNKMKETWTALSLTQPSNLPGHIAYAKKKTSMYESMESNCKKKLEGAGYKHLLSMEDTLADYVDARRAEEAAFLRKSLEGLC
jgi:predicted RNA-binding Zn ribbon-like protein